jgi:hypothetical protein
VTECLVAVVQVVVDREIAKRRAVGHWENLHVGHNHKTLTGGGGVEGEKRDDLIEYLILHLQPSVQYVSACKIEKLGMGLGRRLHHQY